MKLQRYIETEKSQVFDVIIIGGGITGAAVAYAAAGSGLKTLVLEKGDFGGATSAATSKLIHGGLRYLANMEFGLVRESLQERRILGNIAPNFVYPLPFMFANYKHWKGNMWLMKVGMILYDTLSYDKKSTWDKSKQLPNHRTLSLKKTLAEEPNLIRKKLRNSTIFYDYQSIFPERLTLAFLKSAVEYGAEISNYSKVESFLTDASGTINGVVAKDLLNGESKKISTSLTINCGGTWADNILEMAAQGKPISHKVKRSEGIHIITKKIAGKHVISLQKKDGKHLMIMPWRGHSLIGTTDKEYNGTPDEYKVSRQGLEEVIAGVNETYNAKISYKDIIYAYGGLRPLLDDQTEGSYQASRKYEVYDNATDGLNGLITVEGGKYTTSRNLAQHVLQLVEKKLGKKLPTEISNKQYLSGCEIKNMPEFMKMQHAKYQHFGKETVEYISRNYGRESEKIFEIADSQKEYAQVVSHDGELLAEVVYAIEYEAAKTLKDVLLRRTGIGTLGKPSEEILQKVLQLSAKLLNWDEKRKEEEHKSILHVYELPK